jgi:hypothetical protein
MNKVNTRQVFIALLRDLDIDLVCEVGSMNGEDALAFRARLPFARIMALEPNPENLRCMRADPRLATARIDVGGCEPRGRARRSSWSGGYATAVHAAA